jgi:hypothetical protein
MCQFREFFGWRSFSFPTTLRPYCCVYDLDVAHLKKRWPEIVVLMALIGVGAWFFLRPRPDTAGLVKGNGRIEATEIDVATKIAGRLRDLLVDEGDFVWKPFLILLVIGSILFCLALARVPQDDRPDGVIFTRSKFHRIGY